MIQRAAQFIVLGALLLGASASAATSPLLLEYPRGGELFVIGTTQTIRLPVKTKVSPVTVELSRDGGMSYVPIGTITISKTTPPNLAFNVTGGATGSAIIRVKASVKGKNYSATSGTFAISTLPGGGGGGVGTGDLADGSVTNPKLAPLAVSSDKVTSGQSSTGFVLTADGAGGASWQPGSDGTISVPQVVTGNSANPLLDVRNSGSGTGVKSSNTAATGSTSGLIGEANSETHGAGAASGVTGVLGTVVPTTPGGYSAGVRGVNNGTSGTGIGVIGYQGGSGWGVYGETPGGFGVYGLTTNNSAVSSGVRGETFSTNGIAVEAKYSGTGVGVALEVDNGAIKASGVNPFVFVHTATPANKLSANGTDVDNPMCNGDATCLLFITQKLNPSGIVYNNAPVGVFYNTIRNKWEIFNQNNVAIPNNAQFNVMVIKK